MAEASESPSSPVPTISKTMSRAKTPKDFKFGHTIGEGAYSVVQHAVLREGLDTGNVKEFAIKIMDQGFIKKMVNSPPLLSLSRSTSLPLCLR
jgi:hypothetical protein